MNLTHEQVAEVYRLITTQNAEFVRAIARVSLKQSAAVKADMWSQMDDPKPQMPGITDIKDMSLDYFSDMLADFEQSFRNQIEAEHAHIEYALEPDLTFKEP